MDEINHSKEYLNNLAEIARQKDIYSKQVLHTLNTDERFINFFKDYDDASVKQFKDFYIQKRTHWHFNTYNQIDYKNIQNERFYKYAITALKHIQLKKLFNVMSSWMNKECNFDDIEVSVDWNKWTSKPLSCPHIPPIQLHEIQCYKDFLNQLEEGCCFSRLYVSLLSMDFYESESSNDSRWEGENIDDTENYYGRWFTFYDQYYGTAEFKLKPGTRINNEYKYIRHYHQTLRDNEPVITPPVFLPHLSIYKDKDEFVNLFEDKEFKLLYKAHKRQMGGYEFAENIDMDIIYLSEAKEVIPVEDHDDWREGLKIACEQYHRTKTIQILEDVFDEYRILCDMEGGFEEWEGTPELPMFSDHDEYISKIFKGRKLMGEPEDLNF